MLYPLFEYTTNWQWIKYKLNLKMKIIYHAVKNFLKKLAHAYFERPVFFSKSFGGKIKIFNIGYLAEHLETSMNSN